MKKILAAVAVVVLFGACKGGSGSSTTAKPETATKHLTSAKQTASIVARHEQVIRDGIRYESNCRTIDCLGAENRFKRYDTLATAASSLGTDLLAAEPVAAEVRSLEADTRRAINAVLEARRLAHNCFAAHQGGTIAECASQDSGYESALKALGPTLDAWRPYL